MRSRSRLTHRPSDLLYLSRCSSFSIHPHHFHHLGRLLLSAFLFPPSSLFICLCRYLNLFPPPARLVFTSRSFSSPHPGRRCSGNFSQPPHPLIFHQGCSAQANTGCNPSPRPPARLGPAHPPTPHHTPALPLPRLSVAQMHLFNTSSKQISGLLSATGRR